MVPNLNCVVREMLLDMLLDKVHPRTFAGHGRVRIPERKDEISFLIEHIDGRLDVVRRHHGKRLVLPRAIPGRFFNESYQL